MDRITLALLLAGLLTGSGHSAARPAAAITIATYNIHHGRGIDDRVDLPRTASVLRSLAADIIALQEVDQRVTRSGRAPQADSLGALLGMHAAFGAFMPYQDGEYGMAILTRWPILRITPIRLPDGNEPRIALRADIAVPDGDTVAVVNVHFDWVDDDTLPLAQARALVAVLDTMTYRYIVLGDFNDVPGSRTLAPFTARATAATKPDQNRFTFSSTTPEREIDFIFAAPAGAWQVDPARVIDEPLASDHRPVVAVVQSRP